MLSWDEFDKEDGEVVAKATNAGHANEANMDRLDSAGGGLRPCGTAYRASRGAGCGRARRPCRDGRADERPGLACVGGRVRLAGRVGWIASVRNSAA